MFSNNSSINVLEFLEEQTQSQYVCNFILERFCKKICKTQNYKNITETTINTMQFLINYMKHSKVKQNYWDFIMNDSDINKFISSIEYIVDCWINKKEILPGDKSIKHFNNEIIIKVIENITDYRKYSFQSFSSIINEFGNNYTENKIFNV